MDNDLTFILKMKDEATATARKFLGGMRELGEGARKVSNDLKQFEQEQRKVASNSQALRGQLAGLAGIFAGGLAIRQGVTEAVEFNSTLTKMITLAGETEQSVAGIRKELLAMGPELARKPQELAVAFQFIASSGFSGADAMDILDASARGAAIGLGDTKSVADVVTSALNTYGKANLSAADATGILLTAIQAGKAEPEDMAKSLGRVLGVAQTAGVEFHELAAGVAALSLTGLPAAEGVAALRQVIGEFVSFSPQALKIFEKYNVSAADLQKTLRDDGLIAAFTQLRQTFSTDDLAKVIPQIEGLNAILSLTGSNAAAVDEVFKQVAAGGAKNLQEAFRTAAESDAFKFQQGVALINTALIKLGDEVMPMVLKAISALMGVWKYFFDDTVEAANRLQAVRVAAQMVVAALVVWATVMAGMKIQAFLQALGGLVLGMYASVTATGAATAALVAFRAALIATGIGAIVVLIGVLIGALIWLAERTVETNGVMVSGWAKARAEFAGLVAFVVEGAKAMWIEASKYFSNLASAVMSVGRAMQAVMTKDWATAKSESAAALVGFTKAGQGMDFMSVLEQANAGASLAYDTSINQSAAKNGLNTGLSGNGGNAPGNGIPPELQALLDGAGVSPDSAGGGSGSNKAKTALTDQQRLVQSYRDRVKETASLIQMETELANVGVADARARAVSIARLEAENKLRADGVDLQTDLAKAYISAEEKLAGRKFDTDMAQNNMAMEHELDILRQQGPAYLAAAQMFGDAKSQRIAYLDAETKALQDGMTAEQAKMEAENASNQQAERNVVAQAERMANHIRDVQMEAQLAEDLRSIRTADAREAYVQEAAVRAYHEALREGITDVDAYVAASVAAADRMYAANNVITASDGFNDFFRSLRNESMTTGQIISESLTTAFNGLNSALDNLFSGQKVGWGELIAGITKGIAVMIAKALIIQAILWGMETMFPGSGKFLAATMGMSANSSAAAGGAKAAAVAAKATPFAKGGAFTNSIVSSPTLFAFAKGGVPAMGLMGEAGEEAIMPLTRTASGELGVRAEGVGSGGSSGGDMYVTLGDTHISYTSSGDAALDRTNIQMLSKMVEATVDEKIGRAFKRMNKEGGAMNLPFGG